MNAGNETLRFNMVEQQIRPWDVLDQRILDLLMRMRREDFVPEAYRGLAFVDMEIPLGDDAVMWPPRLEARAVQALDIQPFERVLEVGTGSGFVTALLAHLAAEVVSVEIDPERAASAAALLAAHGLHNVQVRVGDAAQDWAQDGSFDAILLTGSVPVLPEALLGRLNPGGRLFAIVGTAPIMVAQRVSSVGVDAYHAENLFDTVADPLRNAAGPSRFVF
jgi:protein-L-isoaspartate(D-aspartate) O-methyltransferase